MVIIIIMYTSKDCYHNKIGICMQTSGLGPESNRYLIAEGRGSRMMVVVEGTMPNLWRIINKGKRSWEVWGLSVMQVRNDD